MPCIARLMRSGVMRWMAVAVLVPMIALGTLGTEKFLAHGHNGHGTHLHSMSLAEGARLAAAQHADDHGHRHDELNQDLSSNSDGDEGGEDPGDDPEGVIVSIDVHKRIPARGIDLGNSLIPATICVIAVYVMPASPDPQRHVGTPGGPVGPLDLVPLSACDRLVRTSRALLI